MTETTSNDVRFADFDLPPDVMEALTKMGIEKPTPIQQVCIPAILEKKDVVGKAETGTGKTIGFGAPLVGRIDTNRVAVQALVLTPTRELAQQVAGVLEELGAGRGLGVALVVGGVHASEQVLKLRSRSQVVVGTPGRVLDFLRERTLSLVWCEVVVLDEADRMLDMGFIDDVSAIIEKIPSERQTLLFSATLPPEIQRLLSRYMKDPATFSTSTGIATVDDIKQAYMEVDFHDKFKTLQKVLDSHGEDTVLIFCNTRRQVIDLDRMLWGHGYSAGSLHGDQEQDVRFKILESFRGGDVRILVATDVASRGLDVDDIACVINYEIPGEVESYVHRIGRTGRAQKSGVAMSFVSAKEWDNWQKILKETKFSVERSGPERVRKSAPGRTRDSSSRPTRGTGDNADTAERSRSRGGRSRGRRDRGGSARGPAREARGPAREAQGPAREAQGPAREARGPAREARGPAREAQGPAREARGPAREARGPAREARGPAREEQVGAAAKREEGPERAAREAATPGGGSSGQEENSADRKSLPRKDAPRPPRIKLDELDDSFLKTDYFDVDPVLLERGEQESRAQARAKASASPRPEASGRGGPGGEQGKGSGSQRGRQRNRRGGGSSRQGAEQGAQAAGGAPGPATPGSGAQAAGGAPSSGAQGGDSKERSGGAPPRRRRRRRGKPPASKGE